jgi:acetoin utilization protein AcuB
LVVKRGSEIIGIISERDLGGPNGSTVCEGHTVGDLMVRDIVTASPEMTVKLAANLLKGYGIGCLPIINNGELVGIVTISDLLDLLASGLIPVAR